jgi:hypothetical protein
MADDREEARLERVASKLPELERKAQDWSNEAITCRREARRATTEAEKVSHNRAAERADELAISLRDQADQARLAAIKLDALRRRRG